MSNADSLQVTLPSDREVCLTRVFRAPRRLVFEAFTKPEYLQRWLLGPPGWAMVVCEVNPVLGGTYRYAWRHADGQEMAMHGVHNEITPPERIVSTQTFDYGCVPQTGVPAIVTATFLESGGITTYSVTILYPSKAERDAVINSGMERGAGASYDRLAELLCSDTAQASSPATA